MKTEHILLSEDPHSTWRTLPEKNPGGAATPESGASVETRKGNLSGLQPITTEVMGFSEDTKQYLKKPWGVYPTPPNGSGWVVQ
jgi:hypothetical protein